MKSKVITIIISCLVLMQSNSLYCPRGGGGRRGGGGTHHGGGTHRGSGMHHNGAHHPEGRGTHHGQQHHGQHVNGRHGYRGGYWNGAGWGGGWWGGWRSGAWALGGLLLAAPLFLAATTLTLPTGRTVTMSSDDWTECNDIINGRQVYACGPYGLYWNPEDGYFRANDNNIDNED